MTRDASTTASSRRQPDSSEQDVGAHAIRGFDSSSRERAPSQRDVADLCGVTYQTVSRVMNNQPRVSPATRLRVLAAMDQLGYRPNGTAQALASGRSRLLGVVSLGTSAYEIPSTLEGIETAAAGAGYSVTIASARSGELEPMKQAVHSLIDRRVAGFILIAPLVSTHLELLSLPSDLPVVAVEGDPESTTPGVLLDQVQGARSATEHLLGLGHPNVWHVSGTPDWYDTRSRETGWRLALDAAGIDPMPLLVGDWGPESGYDAGRVLARINDASAVFVANDTMALGLLRALHEGGRRVPEDVSVVGFDDLPESAFFRPPLTTVRQQFFEIGRRSIHLLIDQIEGRDLAEPRPQLIPSLIIRKSSAPYSPPTSH